MNSLIASILSGTSGVITLALEIAAKAALLCLVAWLAHLLVGRKRIVLRSAIWQVCLLGLALLPLASAAFPRMPVAIWAAEARQKPFPAAVESAQALAHAVDLDADFDLDAPGLHDPEALTALEARNAPVIGRSVGVKDGQIAGAAILALYLLGVSVLMIRLAGSLAAVARLRRASIALEHPAWQAALGRWQRELGLHIPVLLQKSSELSVPVVVGWRQPAILVPEDMALAADRQAIDAVLVHELTHVGRGDYAWNLLSRVVQAVYWPHPLAWLASRMIRHVREEVCDAVCVYSLGDSREYCAVLVDVASGMGQRSSVALGMAMAHTSQLGRRLSRVVECKATGRYLLSSQARAMLVSAVVIATGVLGALTAVHRIAAATDADPHRGAANSGRDAGIEGKASRGESGRKPRAAQPGDAADPGGESDRPEADSKPPRVRTAKVQLARLHECTVQPATLEAYQPASVRSRVMGIVTQVTVDEGDAVRKGDVLAVVDVPDIEAQRARDEAALAQARASVEQAEASLQASEATVAAADATVHEADAAVQKAESYRKFREIQYERVKEIFDKKAVDERTVDEKQEALAEAQGSKDAAEAKVQTSQASLVESKAGVLVAKAVLKAALLRAESAQADLDRSKRHESFREIRAPIDGVVLSRHVETEGFVRPDGNQPLFTIARTDVLTANVALPERDVVRVQRGALASLEFDALDGRILSKVSHVGYSIDPATRTAPAQIMIPNRDGLLKPGMFARARIATGEKPERLSILADAFDPGTRKKGDATVNTCLRVVKNRVVPTDVVLGEADPIVGRVEIVDGLKAGDEVISPLTPELLKRLHEGDRVIVVPEE